MAKPKNSPIFTAPLEIFCQAIHAGLTVAQAAKKAGKNKSWGKREWVKPKTQARIREIAFQYGKQMSLERAKKQFREITIDRNDIIMALADNAGLGDVKMKATVGDRARVAALTVLTDIYMLRPKTTQDLADFKGWTEEELDEFAIHRTVPARFQDSFGKSARPAESGSPSLRIKGQG